jgi:hypothetical protein
MGRSGAAPVQQRKRTDDVVAGSASETFAQDDNVRASWRIVDGRFAAFVFARAENREQKI